MRPQPTDKFIALSRRLNHVPPGWVWAWCANERCNKLVWYDPGEWAAARERKIPFYPVCSAACGKALLDK